MSQTRTRFVKDAGAPTLHSLPANRAPTATSRSFNRALFAALSLIIVASCGPGGGSGAPPPPPPPPPTFPGCDAVGESGSVSPKAICLATDSSGQGYAVWGYQSTASRTVVVPPGATNRFSPDLKVSPPTVFEPTGGATKVAFATPIVDHATWIFGSGGGATASPVSTPSCDAVVTKPDGDSVNVGGVSVRLSTDLGGVLASTIVATDVIEHGDLEMQGSIAGANKTTGSLGGAFHVSGDGAAVYMVPLNVPTGRVGMQPTISLVYESRSDTGPLGLGWKHTGVSQITRCHKTFALDGEASPITFTSSDRFCMDGDRLIPAPGPGANANGVEYRPEHSPFVRVIAFGDDGGSLGPAGWQVQDGHGHTRLYGQTADARLEGERTTFTPSVDAEHSISDDLIAPTTSTVRLAWALSSESDTSRNVITYEYVNSNTCGDFCPDNPDGAHDMYVSAIRYTGTLDGTEKPLRMVRFRYALDREVEDWTVQYVSGFKVRLPPLLKRIEMLAPNPSATSVVRSYRFEYTADPTRAHLEPAASLGAPIVHAITGPGSAPAASFIEHGIAHLARVTECDATDTCRKPTEFGTEDYLTPGADPVLDDPTPRFLDVNTGIGELTWVDPLGDIFTANPEAFLHEGVLIADLNGDGRDDILYRANVSMSVVDTSGFRSAVDKTQWRYRLSVGGEFEATSHDAGLPFQIGQTAIPLPMPRAVDVDMDGRSEILFPEVVTLPPRNVIDGSTTTFEFGVPHWHLFRWTGSAFAAEPEAAAETDGPVDPHPACATPPCFEWPNALYISDLNGDGTPDLLRPFGRRDPGSPVLVDTPWALRRNLRGVLDGAYDPLAFQAKGPPSGTPLSTPFNLWDTLAVPLDSSGRTALLRQSSVSTRYHATLAKGETVTIEGDIATTLLHSDFGDTSGFTYVFLDANGDGLPDALRLPNRGCRPIGGPDTCLPSDAAPLRRPRIAFNTGSGFAAPIDAVSESLLGADLIELNARNGVIPDPGMRPIDINADGRMDLLLAGNNSPEYVRGDTSTLVKRASFQVLTSSGRLGEAPYSSFVVPLAATTLTGPFHPIDITAIGQSARPGRGYPFTQTLDVDGDGWTDIIAMGSDARLHLFRRLPRNFRETSFIRDGLGAVTKIAYSPVRGVGVGSTTAPSCAYPLNCVFRGMTAVSQFSLRTDPTDTTDSFARRFNFAYASPRVDMRGRGWLGFAKRTMFDAQTGAVVETTFPDATSLMGTSYPYANLPGTETSTTNVDGKVLRSIVANAYQIVGGDPTHGEPFAVRVKDRHEWTYENGVVLRHVGANYLYDSTDPYGRLQRSEHSALLTGESTVTTFDYNQDLANWVINIPHQVVETSTASDGRSESHVARYSYDAADLLRTVDLQPAAGAPEELLTDYVRDNLGRIVMVRVRPPSGEPRVTQIVYDNLDGVYPAIAVDAMGHRVRLAYHAGLGVLGEIEDANGVVAPMRYDGFARLKTELAPDGATLSLRYLRSASAGGVYAVEKQVLGGPTTTVHYDSLGRQVLAQTTGYDGLPASLRTAETSYDRVHFRSVAFMSLPHVPAVTADAAPRTSFEYDALGRVTREVRPDGVTGHGYAGLRTTTISPTGHVSYIVEDERGRVIQSVNVSADAGAATHDVLTEYAYGVFSRLDHTTRWNGPTPYRTIYNYDIRGRLRLVIDRDTGGAGYEYDAFGNVTHLRESGSETTIGYDLLGRKIGQSSSIDGVSCYQWDTSANGSGKLGSTTGPGSLPATHTYGYDSVGRLAHDVLSVGGENFDVATGYDVFGRLSEVTYPRIAPPLPGSASFDLTVNYSYSPSSGELAAVMSAGASSTTFWRADRVNAVGQVEQETLGNHLVTTRVFQPRTNLLDTLLTVRPGHAPVQDMSFEYYADRNLRLRTDAAAGTTDRYTYDSLDRLAIWDTGASATHYGYDDLGNLRLVRTTHRTGPVEILRYAMDPVRPHVVAEASDGSSYLADDRGNQYVAPGRTLEFTALNLPSSITDGTGAITRLAYDANGARTIKRKVGADGGITETLYVGGLYERRKTTGGQMHVYSIVAHDRVVAQLDVVPSSTGYDVASRYLLPDQLGSTQAITDGTGRLLSRLRHRAKIKPAHMSSALQRCSSSRRETCAA